MWLHALADGVIAASFLLIPAALFYIYRRRGETNRDETAITTLFIFFMLALGLAHFASLIALWIPIEGLEGALKAAAALLALTTAIVLWVLTPQLLRLPSRDRLQAEIAAHLSTCEELKAARQELEERVDARTKELDEAKQRFEIALRGSPISVFSQDRDMRYVWMHNAPAGLAADQVIGKTDADLLPAEAAETITAAKRQVMETGDMQELEIDFELLGRRSSFYMLMEALKDDANQIVGTTSVAVDITARKMSEDQLRLLLREVTHRSKNLLAVIQAIARQTASRTRSIDDFLQHFSARLVAIGCSLDLLVADDWHGASLRTLVEQQLKTHVDRFGEQIQIEGQDIVLRPEAVQNLGLALHELATNAQKYGALSTGTGSVAIRWAFQDESCRSLKLIWEERGGPVVKMPERSGFGRAMIESVVGRALEGGVTLSFPPKGVRCVIEIPAAQLAPRAELDIEPRRTV